MAKILITGAGGQVGQELLALQQQYPDWAFHAPDRKELDICDTGQLRSVITELQPDYCLNTAAYTAVDRAEEELELAMAVNATAAEQLAQICRSTHTHLFHYSTDYVYAAGIGRPLREEDPTAPAGVYASTKLKGDQLVQAALPGATIIRTSWVYSSFGHNFVKTMLRLGEERDQLRVVFDQIGTPTYARDLARVSLQVIEQIERDDTTAQDLAGIFHYSNEGVCSWYDFALAIFELAGIDCQVSPIESHEYPTPAQRPHFSVLNKAKIKAVTGTSIPHWREALKECLAVLENEK
ncbi:MAG: dTDP-4-dehydrorhamnose reductase [Bacteroidota bacterium]